MLAHLFSGVIIASLDEGCVRGRYLLHEIKLRGCTGSFSHLERLLTQWRGAKKKPIVRVTISTTRPAAGAYSAGHHSAFITIARHGIVHDHVHSHPIAIMGGFPGRCSARLILELSRPECGTVAGTQFRRREVCREDLC